jgi:hypothetical protein
MAADYQLVAMFGTDADARAAREKLLALGVPPEAVTILHRDAAPAADRTRKGLWAALRHRFIPEQEAHALAEGVERGHAVLTVTPPEGLHQAVVQALHACHPLDVAAEAAAWRDQGWSGIYPGRDEYEAELAEGFAANSEGITGAGWIIADYGAVGAPHGGGPDTDIRPHGFLFDLERAAAPAATAAAPEGVLLPELSTPTVRSFAPRPQGAA